MSAVVNDTYTIGDLTTRERTSYEYDSKSYRVKLTNENDVVVNGVASDTWTETSNIEFLADHHNHTDYTQTIRETTTNADGTSKTIDYTFGSDEIAQRVVERNAAGTITLDATHIFGHDGHGSVRVIYDLAATATAIAQAFTFAAYGELLAVHDSYAASSPLATRLSSLGYSGEHFDADVQQQYLRARFYNPTNGRFNRLDPFSGNMQDPQSLHKYAYVHGDPISGVDPSGEAIFWLLGIALLAVGVAAIWNSTGDTNRQLRKERSVGLGGFDAKPKLQSLRSLTIAAWKNLSRSTKEDIVSDLHAILNPVNSVVKGWDIRELGSGFKDKWESSQTAVHVANTLTFDSHVYPIADVNYIWWGMINRLAYQDNIRRDKTSVWNVVDTVTLYRTVLGGVVQLTPAGSADGLETKAGKEAWARFGWYWVVNTSRKMAPNHDLPQAGPNWFGAPFALHGGAGSSNQLLVITGGRIL